jgi:uncharacterized membrane protein YvbJ
MTKDIFSASCVRCGKKATEGSYKHPYCKRCFDWEYKNIGEYKDKLEEMHPESWVCTEKISFWKYVEIAIVLIAFFIIVKSIFTF